MNRNDQAESAQRERASSELTLDDALDFVSRHFLLIAVMTGVTFAGSVYYASTLPRIFQSGAVVIAERGESMALGSASAMEERVGGTLFATREFLEVQAMFARSVGSLTRVVERTRIAEESRFWNHDGREGEREPESRPAPEVLLGRVTSVGVVPESRSLRISVRHHHPEIAAQLANEVALELINGGLERRLETTDNALQWLRTQYDELRRDLDATEQAMFEFLREERALTFSRNERGNHAVQAVDSIGQQLVNARYELDRLGGTVATVERALRTGNYDDVGLDALVNHPTINTLKNRLSEVRSREIELLERYGPEWEEVRAVAGQRQFFEASLQREMRQVLRAYQQEYAAARELESRLRQRFEAAQEVALSVSRGEMVFNGLAREAESQREILALVERRLRELEISRMLEFSNMRLVEAAVVPQTPVSPNQRLIWAAGLLFGAFLGIALSLVRELLDTTVRSRETLEVELGVPVLGIIPSIDPRRAMPGVKKVSRDALKKPDLIVHQFPRSNVAETCRSIRTNLLFLSADKELRSLAVTSGSPKEGKSLTSCSLATVLAQSGSRVLLVDADMRKPRLNKVFQVKSDRGLSSVLVGEAAMEEVVSETVVPNLSFLPCGPIPSDATELIHHRRFDEFLEHAKSLYDIVVFDTPPIGPVTDAAVIARKVDAMVSVVRANKTRKESVVGMVAQLRAVRANLAGVVLNGVDVHKRRGYGRYGYYYYQQYGAYYGETEPSEGASSSAST